MSYFSHKPYLMISRNLDAAENARKTKRVHCMKVENKSVRDIHLLKIAAYGSVIAVHEH